MKRMPNKTRRDNPYQPFCLHVLSQLHHQPRDRRAPPLVGVHALYVRQKMKTPHLLFLYSLGLSSLSEAATTFLVVEGVINQSSSADYPFVVAGDMFKLTVSYSDHFPDIDADPNLGVYLPTDLSMVLEIVGKGVAFEAVGGSVNVSTQPADFPVYSIISQIQPNGHSLFLVFSDINRSHAPLFGDGIPIDFGQYSDYDSIGIAIIDHPDPYAMVPNPGLEPIPINPMDGKATSFSIPEPSITMLIGLTFALGATGRRRIRQGEQDVTPNA